MRFVKMQGLGNDYVYVNAMEEKVEDPRSLAVRLSDRHFGIGADGLILICDSDCADVGMDMYNADGSRGMMCGNGIRCVAKYVHDCGMVSKENIKIETISGIKETKILSDGRVKVNMGKPDIKKRYARVFIQNKEYDVDYISMGNPHAVTYVEDLKELQIEKTGPDFENHRGKEERVNTEFVKILDRTHLEMRVWERGAGETWACGTGACAVLVSSALRNLTEREVRIKLKGGNLLVKWGEEDGNVYMTGPAVTVFKGEITL